jgi:hypothetical protein
MRWWRLAAGACYDSLGLSADEVQSLAGLKEGCGDDMELITVQRPVSSTANGLDKPASAAAAPVFGSTAVRGYSISADGGNDGSVGATGQQQQQQQQLVEVQVPLGSVRASLGWASTFEDAYALVQFLKGYLG